MKNIGQEVTKKINEKIRQSQNRGVYEKEGRGYAGTGTDRE